MDLRGKQEFQQFSFIQENGVQVIRSQERADLTQKTAGKTKESVPGYPIYTLYLAAVLFGGGYYYLGGK